MSAHSITDRPEYVPQLKATWSLGDLGLVLGVVILALTAAGLAFRQFQHQRALDRLASELQNAAIAFREYAQRHDAVPETANFGEAPGSAAPFLPELRWGQPTSVGGYYQWQRNPVKKSEPGGPSGKIGIAAFPPAPPITLSSADMLEIDRRIDDGNLSSGNFRAGFNGWPVLILRAKP